MLSGPSPSPSCLAHGECGHYTTQKSLAELGWSKVSKNAVLQHPWSQHLC
ncbi:unnamed protein product [Lepidochelys kempii]